MLRFVARYGLVRLVGRRALPALMVWDAMVMANRARRIPVVDQTLRRGAGAARRGLAGALTGRRPAGRPGRTGRPEATDPPGAADPRRGRPKP